MRLVAIFCVLLNLGCASLRILAIRNDPDAILQHTGLDDPIAYDRRMRQILADAEAKHGPTSVEVGEALVRVARGAGWKGDEASALAMLERADAIFRMREHRSQVVLLGATTLAQLYARREEFERSRAASDRALEVARASPPLGELADLTLRELGWPALSRNEPAEALAFFELARPVAEKFFGKSSPFTQMIESDVAAAQLALGNRVLARRHVEASRKALASFDYAVFYPRQMFNEFLLAWIQRLDGEDRGAADVERNALDIAERRLAALLESEERDGQRLLLESMRPHLNQILTIALDTRGAEAQRVAMTALFQRKGRIFETTRSLLDEYRAELTPAEARSLEELVHVRARLSQLVLSADSARIPKVSAKRAERLYARAEELEGEIQRGATGAKLGLGNVSSRRVQDALPPNSALVEYAIYERFEPELHLDRGYFNRWSEARLAACVLRSEGSPQCLDLGEQVAFDQAISRLRKGLRDPRSTGVKDAARFVDEIVFSPIREFLGDEQLVFVAPDGPLHLLPFSALVDERGRYLLDRYTFSYLLTGRDLLSRVRLSARGPPLLVANPDFDAPHAGPDSDEGTVVRGISRRSFRPLPETRAEAAAIAKLLPDARVLDGKEATEDRIRSVRGPRILHLATHGFFSETPNDYPFPRFANILGPQVSTGEDAMLRSGLVLAGGNIATDQEGDGLLTALEVRDLDLAGTQLVVLSACDTGLGHIAVGEGVYGLRRAFAMAGAESIVMTLWIAEDRATRHFMELFYRRVIDGTGRAEALRLAQRDLASRLASRHPFYWASFIVSGHVPTH